MIALAATGSATSWDIAPATPKATATITVTNRTMSMNPNDCHALAVVSTSGARPRS